MLTTSAESDMPFGKIQLPLNPGKSFGRLFALGLAMLLLGVAAIVWPIMATFGVELYIGWMLLFSGGILLISAFAMHGVWPFFGMLLGSVASIAAGLFILANPLAGAVTLTFVIGAIFIVQGVSEIALALALRPRLGWAGILLSGLASVIVSMCIASGWPAISLIMLGILFGVNFVSTGLAYIYVSLAQRLSV